MDKGKAERGNENDFLWEMKDKGLGFFTVGKKEENQNDPCGVALQLEFAREMD